MTKSGANPNGLGGDAVDFDAFYRWLDGLTVQLPDTGANDPISPREVASLMVKVQNNRSDLSRAIVLLERRLGESKRKVGILTEQRRLEKAETEADPRVQSLPRAQREAFISAASGDASASISIEKSRRETIEAALRAAKVQVDVLETCKQTLNTYARIGDEIPDAFSPRNRRPR